MGRHQAPLLEAELEGTEKGSSKDLLKRRSGGSDLVDSCIFFLEFLCFVFVCFVFPNSTSFIPLLSKLGGVIVFVGGRLKKFLGPKRFVCFS